MSYFLGDCCAPVPLGCHRLPAMVRYVVEPTKVAIYRKSQSLVAEYTSLHLEQFNAGLQVGLRLLLAPLGSNVVIRTASCAIGIGLPVYSTYRAIEKKDQDEKERWLLYWAAYGSFSTVEVFADKFLSSVPLYYHVKFAILVWLQFPSNGGSKHVYKRYLRPFFLKHQAKIDRILNILSKELRKFMSKHEDEIRFVENMAIRGATTANYIVNGLDQPGDSEAINTIEGSPATEEADTPRAET